MVLNKKLFIFIFLFSILGFYRNYFSNYFSFNHNFNNNLIKSSNIAEQKKKNILLNTNVFQIKINLYGGNINEIKLLKYKKTLDDKSPIILQTKNDFFTYQVINNVFSEEKNNFGINSLNLKYSLEKKNTFFDKKKEIFHVSLIHCFKNGVIYKKIFTFYLNKYNFNVEHYIYNNSNNFLKLILFGEIIQTINNNLNSVNYDSNNTYENSKSCLYLNNKKEVIKHNFSEIKKNNFISFIKNFSWIAMSEKYFSSVLIPKNDFDKNVFYIGTVDSNFIVAGYQTPTVSVKPNSLYKFSNIIWAGPNLNEEMLKIAPKLDSIVNYGFFSFLAKFLFFILSLINKIFKNWGFSIIFLTIFLKICMYPFAKFQYISTLKIQKLQPKIDNIYKKFKNNYIKINQEIFSLYKSNNINPLISFLITILQMPIFISIYNILTNLIELRHSPFILWIKDLSSYDPYYILPIILGITIYITQIFTVDMNTNKFTKSFFLYNIFSLFFSSILSFFFMHLPSGLLIYYIFNNIFTIFQQIKFKKDFLS